MGNEPSTPAAATARLLHTRPLQRVRWTLPRTIPTQYIAMVLQAEQNLRCLDATSDQISDSMVALLDRKTFTEDEMNKLLELLETLAEGVRETNNTLKGVETKFDEDADVFGAGTWAHTLLDATFAAAFALDLSRLEMDYKELAELLTPQSAPYQTFKALVDPDDLSEAQELIEYQKHAWSLRQPRQWTPIATVDELLQPQDPQEPQDNFVATALQEFIEMKFTTVDKKLAEYNALMHKSFVGDHVDDPCQDDDPNSPIFRQIKLIENQFAVLAETVDLSRRLEALKAQFYMSWTLQDDHLEKLAMELRSTFEFKSPISDRQVHAACEELVHYQLAKQHGAAFSNEVALIGKLAEVVELAWTFETQAEVSAHLDDCGTSEELMACFAAAQREAAQVLLEAPAEDMWDPVIQGLLVKDAQLPSSLFPVAPRGFSKLMSNTRDLFVEKTRMTFNIKKKMLRTQIIAATWMMTIAGNMVTSMNPQYQAPVKKMMDATIRSELGGAEAQNEVIKAELDVSLELERALKVTLASLTQ